MMEDRYSSRIISSIVALMMLVTTFHVFQEPVYAASQVNKESLITDVRNPSNGVIKYDVTVPAGERIDYSVELTPDKRSGTVDKITGTWINRTKKTVKKTITANVKFLSNEYTIKASYSKKSLGQKISYRDSDTAVSALKTSVVTSKLAWDFSKLGKGNKTWKYRYKYVPCKNGYKKYLQVFNKNGERIKNYVKQFVTLDKITKIIKEMKNK